MRMKGFKSIVLAAGLTIAGIGHAAPPPANPTGEPSATVAATQVAPSTAAAPADPVINFDGTAQTEAEAQGLGRPADFAIGLQDQVTPTGREAHWFHNTVLLPLITLISLFVLGLLAWVIVRYRRAANPEPSRTSHNTVIEVVWTLVPVLILVAIAIPSIRLLANQYRPAPEGAVTLKAIGNQWFWSYEYPDNGGISITANMLKEQNEVEPGQRFRTDADGPRLLATDSEVVLPVGVPIRLITTANDVIHSWAMPAFWIKLDAIPGRLNETTFTIEKPGVYFGQCSELCGARHAYMPIKVRAVPQPQFAAWVRAQGGSMPSDAPAAPAADDATTTPAGGAVPSEDNIVDNTVAVPATTNQSAVGSVE